MGVRHPHPDTRIRWISPNGDLGSSATAMAIGDLSSGFGSALAPTSSGSGGGGGRFSGAGGGGGGGGFGYLETVSNLFLDVPGLVFRVTPGLLSLTLSLHRLVVGELSSLLLDLTLDLIAVRHVNPFLWSER